MSWSAPRAIISDHDHPYSASDQLITTQFIRVPCVRSGSNSKRPHFIQCVNRLPPSGFHGGYRGPVNRQLLCSVLCSAFDQRTKEPSRSLPGFGKQAGSGRLHFPHSPHQSLLAFIAYFSPRK